MEAVGSWPCVLALGVCAFCIPVNQAAGGVTRFRKGATSLVQLKDDEEACMMISLCGA